MNTLTWILAGILVYWLAIVTLRRRGWLPEYAKAQGPLLSIHTSRGRAFLNWLASPRRFWRAWANFGLGFSIVVMALAFFFLLTSAILQMLRPEPTMVTQPRNVLVIPGVNDFLPLSVAPEIIAGLVVALVVHEGGHGLLCRVEDIDIKSLGVVLLAVIPLGAFVEPDEESRTEADRGQQSRMFAAGVTNNFAVTVIAFTLLFGPVVGSIAVAPGVHVGTTMPASGADAAGIGMGDRITAVEGTPVEDESELNAILDNETRSTADVEINGERTRTVQRRLLVTSNVTVEGIPTVPPNATVAAVNGTNVSTRGQLKAAFRNRTVGTVTTADGRNVTFPVGALATVQRDGAMAETEAPTTDALVITRIDGQRIVTQGDLQDVMETTEPNETVVVEAYSPDGPATYNVTLGNSSAGDYGALGVRVYEGFTGVEVNDFGVRTYPSAFYLGLIGGGGGQAGFLDRVAVVLLLPIAGVATELPFNFAGFTGGLTNFYVAAGGPLSFLGGWLFLLANLLFWTGWINLNLGFFNAIPGYPLDGGHILRNTAEAVVSRLPIGDRRRAVRVITTSIGVTMLASLLLMLFGEGLLA
ncbi:MAG: site-2 protease family protein [Halobacteriales archaeon]